jgi:cellulose synthase/poly-beta-1,6-N-acetylglucosamine synthase-like glycosyltransferase
MQFEEVLYWSFISAIAVQCAYAAYFFLRVFVLFKTRHPAIEAKGVSIIICAKDEVHNLRKNLPVVLSQKYGADFEVIVVNDASTDSTEEVLQEMSRQYAALSVLTILPEEARTFKGKKFALSKGLGIAKYDWLLLTDADCLPASDKWLEEMVAPLGAGKEIVAGYGGYHTAPGVLNAFTRWETLHTFMQYSTYAMAGLPYMATGRNMACIKSILLRAQQHELWNNLPSGDDDMLVRIGGTANNTAIVCHDTAFTYSDAKPTWKEWVAQKQRHLSTGKFYKAHIQLLLGGYALSHALMWLCFLIMLFFYWKTAFILAGIRCKAYWVLWSAAAGRVQEKKLIPLFPFFDPAWAVYNFVFLPYITWKNKQNWK